MDTVGRASGIDAVRPIMSSLWLTFVSLMDMTILSNVCEEMGLARPRLDDKLSTDDLPELKPLMCTAGE